ncbi:TetR/AcrR family transcriptional regulator [Streptomyces sp. NBC_00059]|uniref:TetR/AcrR family transcriptional regulator n=1 Tax=Streptomyces sp. NBC_00059 TaxID=2975635 RepID=UPI0022564A94|nr:TetR/AcrR family transcriptional regulator [Streptomyces sp. NBC_00059]MCX5417646.1 TetR/AcrR family transcriptional regulator [Streptomyces sp. NBC_00059]
MAVESSPRRRADAERNATAIIDAGVECLLVDPQASMAAVARAAGVSRVTLYSHFPTRESLLKAALERSVAEAVHAVDAEAGDVGPADEALARLMRSSWQVLDRNFSAFAAAAAALPPDVIRDRHDRILRPVRDLILRGQQEDAIRRDLSADWLVTVVYQLMHAAAGEVQAGRLTSAAAPDVLTATVLAALRTMGGQQ